MQREASLTALPPGIAMPMWTSARLTVNRDSVPSIILAADIQFSNTFNSFRFNPQKPHRNVTFGSL